MIEKLFAKYFLYILKFLNNVSLVLPKNKLMNFQMLKCAIKSAYILLWTHYLQRMWFGLVPTMCICMTVDYIQGIGSHRTKLL